MPQDHPSNICRKCGTERRPRTQKKKSETFFRPCLPCFRKWKKRYLKYGPMPDPDPWTCQTCGLPKPPKARCLMCRRKNELKYYVRSTRVHLIDYLRGTIGSLGDDVSKPWSDYPCIEWPFGKDKDGYGKVTVAGKSQRAHRVVLEIATGKLDDGQVACHYCDNPSCFRPTHIFSGSSLDNVRDRVNKGRSRYVPARGEQSGHSKLTALKVLEMRELSRLGVSYFEIGRRYNVSAQSATCVCKRTSWWVVAQFEIHN